MSSYIFKQLEAKKQYKYPFIFLGIYVTCLLITVCLANRIVSLGTVIEPGGIFVFCFTFSICDIVGEVYGYSYPRLFIWIGVIAEFIFAFVVTTVSHMPYPSSFEAAIPYQIVFDPTLWYVFSSLIALLLGEFSNIYLLSKSKLAFQGKYFIIRSFVSTAVGQAVLTIVVDLLIYSGKFPTKIIIDLMINGYIWKITFAFIFLFPSWLLVKHLKKVEDIDYFDIHTNFTPFSLQLNQEH